MRAGRQGRTWLTQRAPIWHSLGEGVRALRRRRTSPELALKTLEGYRSLSRDLATSRRLMPGTNLNAALETLYAQYHAAVNRAPHHSGATILKLFRVEIPEIVRSMRTAILWVTLLFVLSAGAGWWLIQTHPTLIGLIASEQMINRVEGGRLWTEGILNIAPSSILSIRIFSNNIVVSIMAFCAGLFYGLGTFYMVSLNGLMLGGLFAFTRQHGLDDELFNFVIAHGTVELSIICLAGAAGMTLGQSLFRPALGNRRESFQDAAARMGKLLLLCVPLLVGCGLIEGFVSPDPTFPLWSRVAIGICYWFVMFAALTGRLFGARPARSRSDTASTPEARVVLEH